MTVSNINFMLFFCLVRFYLDVCRLLMNGNTRLNKKKKKKNDKKETREYSFVDRHNLFERREYVTNSDRI